MTTTSEKKDSIDTERVYLACQDALDNCWRLSRQKLEIKKREKEVGRGERRQGREGLRESVNVCSETL